MKSYFYVLYPSNEAVKILLDAIRIFAAEKQRRQVHITVRGPYERQLNFEFINSCASIIKGERIKITGVGNFFDFNQNTVFFQCSNNPNLKKIWNKTTYPNFNPHITVYDGNDTSYAQQIYEKLQQNFKSFEFIVEKLSLLDPIIGNTFEKLDNVNFDEISNILGYPIGLSDIKKLSQDERLKCISIFCSILYKTGE
jgi:2'-5' RNA ligase